MLGLALFAFYQDTINVSLPKKFELKSDLPPTYLHWSSLSKNRKN